MNYLTYYELYSLLAWVAWESKNEKKNKKGNMVYIIEMNEKFFVWLVSEYNLFDVYNFSWLSKHLDSHVWHKKIEK